jgi:hypothetical protein
MRAVTMENMSSNIKTSVEFCLERKDLLILILTLLVNSLIMLLKVLFILGLYYFLHLNLIITSNFSEDAVSKFLVHFCYQHCKM